MANHQEHQTCKGYTHHNWVVPEGPALQEHNDRHTRRHSENLWTINTT